MGVFMSCIASLDTSFPTLDMISKLHSDPGLASKATWLFGYLPGNITVWRPVLDLCDTLFVKHFIIPTRDNMSAEEKQEWATACHLVPYFGNLGDQNFLLRWDSYATDLVKTISSFREGARNTFPPRFRARLAWFVKEKGNHHFCMPIPTKTFVSELAKLLKKNAFALIEVCST
jgi:hypothetical protein